MSKFLSDFAGSSGDSKLVSVIVPLYNAEDYVAETLRSLLAQTYQNLEILIVDDGSPDNSVEVCRQFTDPRIQILRQENRGLSGARNTGIRQATGDYIGFLDADDLWHPEKVEAHVRHLKTAQDVGISFSYSSFIQDSGEPAGIYQIPTKIRNLDAPYVLCRNPIGNGSSAIVRRIVLDEMAFPLQTSEGTRLSYFDEQLRSAEDLEFWVRVASQSHWKIEGIAQALTLYRINSTGLSANILRQFQSIETVIHRACDAAPEVLGPYRNLARAYYMRYVARRAVTLRDGGLAVKMTHQALATSMGIFWEEPRRTLMTLCAAYLLYLMPQSIYFHLETLALRTVGSQQKSRIAASG